MSYPKDLDEFTEEQLSFWSGGRCMRREDLIVFLIGTLGVAATIMGVFAAGCYFGP